MFPANAPTTFSLYRWSNGETYHDYPYIAVAEDRSVFMSLGDYGMLFEWRLSKNLEEFLTHDFAPTDTVLRYDFATLRATFDAVYIGGVRSGLVRFDPALRPRLLDLSLHKQVMAEDGPEYLIQGLREYQRMYREPVRLSAVTPPERALLDLVTTTFAEFAAQCAEQLREPVPPRFRHRDTDSPLH